MSRLRWRCRRGTKELDLLLERFLDDGYPRLAAHEREAFERLLDAEDDQLVDWLLSGASRPEEEDVADIVHTIRDLR